MAKKQKKKFPLLLIILLIIIIVVLVFLIREKQISTYNAVYDLSDTEYYDISVQPGMTGKQIAALLEEKGIIGNAGMFRNKAKKLGLDNLFQAGNYKLSPSMSTDEIYEALQHAKKESVSFTIPEGYYIRQIAEKLSNEGLISSPEDFYKACEDDYDYWFIPDQASEDPTGIVSARANRLEGFLFPNTYEVYKDASAHEIIEKMLDYFESVYTDELKAKADSLGRTTSEIVTIASMIERETRVDSERSKVASVIYNRLDIGMPLQIDACIQYCLGEQKDRVLYVDLEIDSPYNTYKVNGLPVGPICSPGKASILAALDPEDTDYIYYVLKSGDSIEHNFAENSAGFNTYKQQYLNTL